MSHTAPALAAALLVLVACGSAAVAATRVDSGIVGVVRAPDCTLTREGRSCFARRPPTTIEVYRLGREAAVARARVGPLGTFRVLLVPGRYVLRLAPGVRAHRARWVTVRPHAFTLVVLERPDRTR